ncbi:MAG: hypothetical protein WKF71_09305 [Pyrinomonadaceae bacterium]
MKTITKFSFGLLISIGLTGVAFAQTPTSTPVKTTETTTTKTTTTTPTTTKTTTTIPTTTKITTSIPTTPTTPTTSTTTTMKTDVVQNADGTYSVIEYPVGKEVVVEFMPTDKAMTAKGMARVLRTGEETTINFDLSGLDASSSYYAYAVDPMGKTTFLGPITAENGIAKTSFTTPSNQFMLVLSPTEGLDKHQPMIRRLLSVAQCQKVTRLLIIEQQLRSMKENKSPAAKTLAQPMRFLFLELRVLKGRDRD